MSTSFLDGDRVRAAVPCTTPRAARLLEQLWAARHRGGGDEASPNLDVTDGNDRFHGPQLTDSVEEMHRGEEESVAATDELGLVASAALVVAREMAARSPITAAGGEKLVDGNSSDGGVIKGRSVGRAAAFGGVGGEVARAARGRG